MISAAVKFTIKPFLFVCVLLVSTNVLAADILIKEAWIREAPPGAHALAGYARVKNNGNKVIYLEGASSKSFGMSMLHMSKMDKQQKMTMNHMDRITIPAGQTVQLKPGGIHIMLMRPERRYKIGDKVTINLQFSGGLEKKVEFSVLRK